MQRVRRLPDPADRGRIGTDPILDDRLLRAQLRERDPRLVCGHAESSTSSAIQAKLAATERTGIAQLEYPASTASNVLFKMGDAQSGNVAANVSVLNSREVAGTETAGQFCGAPTTYPVYFVAEFDRSFSGYGTWQNAPTGANAFTEPTGALGWSYHEVNSGGSTPTIAATTTSDGASAVSWQQSDALANTWIQATPPSLTQGNAYEASVTLPAAATYTWTSTTASRTWTAGRQPDLDSGDARPSTRRSRPEPSSTAGPGTHRLLRPGRPLASAVSLRQDRRGDHGLASPKSAPGTAIGRVGRHSTRLLDVRSR